MIRVLIVDDETPSQTELIHIISQYPHYQIVGTACSGKEALELIAKVDPQVVFLDIQLFDISGLDLAQKITSINKDIAIVFATAHDDYAVKAFELRAVDYIVKPFDELRIFQTLERIRSSLCQPTFQEQLTLQAPPLERVCVSCSDRLVVINCQSIVYISALERKTAIKLEDDTFHSFYSLKDLYDKLNKRDFLRVHRSYVVNLQFLKEIEPWFHGSYLLTMADKQKSQVPVSRNYAKDLKHRLGISCTP